MTKSEHARIVAWRLSFLLQDQLHAPGLHKHRIFNFLRGTLGSNIHKRLKNRHVRSKCGRNAVLVSHSWGLRKG